MNFRECLRVAFATLALWGVWRLFVTTDLRFFSGSLILVSTAFGMVGMAIMEGPWIYRKYFRHRPHRRSDEVLSLPIIPYTEERIPNPNPAGPLPWHEHQKVRNALVRVCRSHGPTGPLGILPIGFFESMPNVRAWEAGDQDPVYFVIDDQYNDELYQYLEFCKPGAMTKEWLSDVVAMLHDHFGWGVCISSLSGNYAIIFADRLLVTGEKLGKCRSVSEILEAVYSLSTAGSESEIRSKAEGDLER